MHPRIFDQLLTLPRLNNPSPDSEPELCTDVANLVDGLISRLESELRSTTCDWDREDYPRINREFPSIPTLTTEPDCD